MNDAQFADLARKLASGELLLQDLRLYIVVLGLFLLGGLVTSWYSYWKVRAEQKAARVNFDQVLAQLEQTTKLTKSIERTISHEDWRLREYNTLRRQKLEELMRALSACHSWVAESQCSHAIFGSDPPTGSDPNQDVVMLGLLYFPELTEIQTFNSAYSLLKVHLLEVRGRLIPLRAARDVAYARKDTPLQTMTDEIQKAEADLMAETDKASASFLEVYRPLHESLRRLQNDASALMAKIIRPSEVGVSAT